MFDNKRVRINVDNFYTKMANNELTDDMIVWLEKNSGDSFFAKIHMKSNNNRLYTLDNVDGLIFEESDLILAK